MAQSSKYSIREINLRCAIEKSYGDVGGIDYFGDGGSDDERLYDKRLEDRSKELIKKIIGEDTD